MTDTAVMDSLAAAASALPWIGMAALSAGAAMLLQGAPAWWLVRRPRAWMAVNLAAIRLGLYGDAARWFLSVALVAAAAALACAGIVAAGAGIGGGAASLHEVPAVLVLVLGCLGMGGSALLALVLLAHFSRADAMRGDGRDDALGAGEWALFAAPGRDEGEGAEARLGARIGRAGLTARETLAAAGEDLVRLLAVLRATRGGGGAAGGSLRAVADALASRMAPSLEAAIARGDARRELAEARRAGRIASLAEGCGDGAEDLGARAAGGEPKAREELALQRLGFVAAEAFGDADPVGAMRKLAAAADRGRAA